MEFQYENIRNIENFLTDKLLGLGKFVSRSHEVFSECQFYLADGSITPEWDGDTILPGLGIWSDHL